MRVSVIKTLPHTWELRHHTALELRLGVTTSVAAAAQAKLASWGKKCLFPSQLYRPVRRRTVAFFVCSACVGTKALSFSCCGMYKKFCAEGRPALAWNPANRDQSGELAEALGAHSSPGGQPPGIWTAGVKRVPHCLPSALHAPAATYLQEPTPIVGETQWTCHRWAWCQGRGRLCCLV